MCGKKDLKKVKAAHQTRPTTMTYLSTATLQTGLGFVFKKEKKVRSILEAVFWEDGSAGFTFNRPTTISLCQNSNYKKSLWFFKAKLASMSGWVLVRLWKAYSKLLLETYI